MRTRFVALALTALIAVVAAAPAAAQDTATVYVVHGISGGALGAAAFNFPVDISVSGVGCAITGLAFTGIVGPLELPAGSYDIDIYPATGTQHTCAGDPAISASGVTVKAGENYSIVAHQDADGAPTASVFRNENLEARGDKTATIAARHAAWAPDVEVLVRKGNSVTPVGPFANGEQLGELTLPNGNYELGLGLPGTGEPVFGYFAQKLKQNHTYYVYAFGWVGNGTLAFVVHEIRD